MIFREEEREMAKLCAEDQIAMTPYSALAGGRLSKHPGETSKRLEEDSYARLKYDAAAKAVNLELTPQEIHYLEEAYVPHKLVGVMAQNTSATAKKSHVWSTGNQRFFCGSSHRRIFQFKEDPVFRKLWNIDLTAFFSGKERTALNEI